MISSYGEDDTNYYRSINYNTQVNTICQSPRKFIRVRTELQQNGDEIPSDPMNLRCLPKTNIYPESRTNRNASSN